MTGRRVVVTGLGVVSPLGTDLETSWKNLKDGVSGIGPITQFDASNHQTQIAGEVKGYDPLLYIDRKQAKRMDLFTQFAIGATKMAMEDSGLVINEDNRDRVGTIIGVGLGGLETIETNHTKMVAKGPKRISPFFIPVLIANMAAGQVSMETTGRGPNYCTTSACASGLHAVGCAYTDIMMGRADAMVCGGAESTITPLAIGGFNAAKALSTRNDEPTKASRPFEKNRSGFVMGEGSGILILETLEHAQARGARIYAEIKGFGMSGDAYHMTAPDETGAGMALALKAAMREGGITSEDIDHVNAHGTSTFLNDLCETRAMKLALGDQARKISITANKSMMGHLLGAAGGVESVFTVKSIAEGTVPGTINHDEADPECDLDYVTDGTREQDIRYALCNSFGFGGTNASVLYKKFEE